MGGSCGKVCEPSKEPGNLNLKEKKKKN